MTAVQLSRLRTQVSELSWKFTQPQEFQSSLQDLFEYYADRVYRPGQIVQTQTQKLIPTYHTPLLVLHQLELELGKHCQGNPSAALALANILWKDAYLEPRILATFILGQAPLNPPDPVPDILIKWCQPNEDKEVLNAALIQGGVYLRKEYPEKWLELVQKWLNASDPSIKAIGLQALLPLIQNRQFENLPQIFKLISPIIQTSPAATQTELLTVIQTLIERTPTETAFFLRQVVNLGIELDAIRLIRRTLKLFNPKTQASLRASLMELPPGSMSK